MVLGKRGREPEQSDWGAQGRLRSRPKPNPPNVQLPSEQPKQRGKPRRLRLIPPTLQNQTGPSRAESTDPGSSHSETSTCYSQDVTNYDVDRGVEAAGTPQAGDIEYWGKQKGAAEFIRSQSGLETIWVGIRPLGKGGCGIAGLWELRGNDGQVINQMVIKQETHTNNNWKKHTSIRKVPQEVKVMSKLNKTHCHAIPRLFNYKRYPHVFKHRTYMEYCPHKDLSVLCKRYGRFRQHLPEPFLWDTFYHLVEAATAMRNGSKREKWDFEIVHRDLKPGNVFLGEENEDKGFPFYPVAKTGDFGLAVMTSAKDPSNPSRYRGPGTQGYLAPEQVNDDTPKEEQGKLSSYTNVWAIGATMLELLTLYAHLDYINDPEYNDAGRIRVIETNKEPEYSQDLRGLIKACIEPKCLERIKLEDLRARIKSYHDRIIREYRQSNDDWRARYESDSLLYYARNEINNMPTGEWEPYKAISPSKPEEVKFPDHAWPVVFPRFVDGPEAGGKKGGDGNGVAGKEGGGIKGLKGGLPDGAPDGGADANSGDSLSPPPSDPQPPTPFHVPAPQAPAGQPAPRMLRNGRILGYF